MSKTMTYLRKYQKVVFSVLCVVLIVTWGLSYSADQLMTWGRGGPNNPGAEVVLTWVGGKLTVRDLELRRRAHFNVNRYLMAVVQKASEAGGRPAAPIFVQDGNNPLPPSSDPQTVIGIMLRAEQARRLGIVVSEDAVKDFLKRLSGDVLHDGDLGAIARETLGKEMSDEHLMAQLQEELLAQEARLITVGSVAGGSTLRGTSLGDDWEYFSRLNRRTTIEAFGLDVDKFLADVKGEPSPKEMRALFDKYKDYEPDPNSAEPGFRNVKRVVWEHVKFDFAPYLEKAKTQITEEQIEKRYEDGKAKSEFKEKPPEKKEEGQEDEKKEEGDKKVDPEKKDGEDKDAPEKKDAEKKDPENKEAEKKSAEPKAGDKPASDPVTPGDPSAKKVEPEKPAETKPAEKADDKPAAEKPEAKPGEEKPEEEKPADPVTYKPLTEVREQILNELARPIAQEALEKDRLELTAALKDYSKQRTRFEVAQKASGSKSKVPDPGEFDAAGIAKRLGLKHGITAPVNRFEVADEELGREGMITVFEPRFQQFSFADYAYAIKLTPFERIGPDKPAIIAGVRDRRDMFSTGWEVWAVKEEAPTPAKFEDKDVQERIKAAWRRQQAVILAKKEAEVLAERADGKASLKDVAPEGAKVVEPPSFSWLSGGSFTPAMGGRGGISQVEGIDRPGYEFMDVVARLQPGKSGAALNGPHSRVYVIRLLGQEPDEETLREQFLQTGSSQAVKMAAFVDSQRLADQWDEELIRDLKVVFHKPLQESNVADE